MTRPLALLPHEAKALAAGRLAQVWRPIKPSRKQSWLTDEVLRLSPRAAITDDGGTAQFYHPQAGKKFMGVQVADDSPLTCIYCPLGCPGDELKHEGSTLEILSVRAVRLDEATEEDARAWGVEPCHLGIAKSFGNALGMKYLPHHTAAVNLWDAHFGKRYPYAARPWAWAAEVRAK